MLRRQSPPKRDQDGNSPTRRTASPGTGSARSWWGRDTDTKSLAVTAVGVVLGGLALVLSIVALRASGANDDDDGSAARTAPRGELELPESVAEGPASFLVPGHLNEVFNLPVDPDELGLPSLTGENHRRWCSDNTCSFDLLFEGATRPVELQNGEALTSYYVSQVFPSVDDGPAVYSASGSNYDGTGGVVAETPFLEGWFCVRMAAAYGDAQLQELYRRTEWSRAACFLLDAEGYVTQVEWRD